MDLVISFLSWTGKYSSLFLFLITTFLFYKWQKKDYDCIQHPISLVHIYLFSFFFNYIFNIICKIILKQPRPKEDLELFHITKTRAPWYQFGTPSTNIQSIWFTTTFATLTMKNIWISIPFLILSINTIIQQLFLSHSYYTYQVIIGMVLGILIGIASYLFSRYLFKGDIIEKPDEDAPDIIGLL
jgi:hypothetical protein